MSATTRLPLKPGQLFSEDLYLRATKGMPLSAPAAVATTAPPLDLSKMKYTVSADSRVLCSVCGVRLKPGSLVYKYGEWKGTDPHLWQCLKHLDDPASVPSVPPAGGEARTADVEHGRSRANNKHGNQPTNLLQSDVRNAAGLGGAHMVKDVRSSCPRDGAAHDLAATRHGRDCPKVQHVGDGYLHGADDDRPYDVDGVLYCGRCHGWMGASVPTPEAGARQS